MSVTIRQATMKDTDVIVRFNVLMAKETESIPLDGNRLRKGVEAILSDPLKGIYFVAEQNGAVVGQLMITYEWSDWRNGNFWWIQSVYVDATARGSGVFTALFKHVHRLASSRNDVCGLRLYVEANNSKARQTYERLGMKKSHYEMYETDFVL